MRAIGVALVVAVALTVSSAAQSPAPPGTASPDLGRELFTEYCASCHGRNGRGDGPLSGELRHVVPNLTRLAARNGGMFPGVRVAQIIDGRGVSSHGNREMPVWGFNFSTRPGVSADEVAARIAALTRFLESIQERAGE